MKVVGHDVSDMSCGMWRNGNAEGRGLIRKIYHSKNGEVEIFGTGKPLRQFMYAGDFAQVIYEMVKRDITDSFNVATPEVRSIFDIAYLAMNSIKPEGFKISLNPDYPDGQFRKDVDISKFKKHFPDFEFTSLAAEIR